MFRSFDFRGEPCSNERHDSAGDYISAWLHGRSRDSVEQDLRVERVLRDERNARNALPDLDRFADGLDRLSESTQCALSFVNKGKVRDAVERGNRAAGTASLVDVDNFGSSYLTRDALRPLVERDVHTLQSLDVGVRLAQSPDEKIIAYDSLDRALRGMSNAHRLHVAEELQKRQREQGIEPLIETVHRQQPGRLYYIHRDKDLDRLHDVQLTRAARTDLEQARVAQNAELSANARSIAEKIMRDGNLDSARPVIEVAYGNAVKQDLGEGFTATINENINAVSRGGNAPRLQFEMRAFQHEREQQPMQGAYVLSMTNWRIVTSLVTADGKTQLDALTFDGSPVR